MRFGSDFGGRNLAICGRSFGSMTLVKWSVLVGSLLSMDGDFARHGSCS